MTGTAFRRFRQEIPYSFKELADRWRCCKKTIQRKEEMDEVTQIYADAMRTLVREHRDDAPF